MISPIIGRNCRYYPTCSCYADKAIERHGVIKGGFLAIIRILRCHPWSKHSYVDPVPQKFIRKHQEGTCASEKTSECRFNDI